MRIGCLARATTCLWPPLLGGLAGCSNHHPLAVDVGNADSPAVARVGQTPIRASAVATQMRRNGGDRRRALDDLVTFELLAQAAAADGADVVANADDLQVQQSIKVQRLVEREIEPRITRSAIDERDIHAVYDRAKSRFVHGRLVQVAVLCVFTGARMKPEPRARAQATARQLKSLLATRPAHSAKEFEDLAKEPTWQDRKVSVTTVWQGDDQPFPAVVGRAVQGLTKPGQMTELVGDETGYYIALYLADKPPVDLSYADAAPQIRQEMYEPWRRQKFLQLSLAMSEGHDITVFPENFPLMAEEPGQTTGR